MSTIKLNVEDLDSVCQIVFLLTQSLFAKYTVKNYQSWIQSIDVVLNQRVKKYNLTPMERYHIRQYIKNNYHKLEL